MKRFNPLRKPAPLIVPPPTAPGNPSSMAAPASPAPDRTEPAPKSAAGIHLSFNSRKKFIELRFDEKPDENLREEMKAAHWRWYGPAGCWYTKDTPENQTWAEAFIARHGTKGAVPATNVPVSDTKPPIHATLPPVAVPQVPPMRGFSVLGMSSIKPPEPLAIAKAHLLALEHFIGPIQREAVLQGFKGEEKQFFFDKLAELVDRIALMPATYGQRDKAGQAVAHLHYFAGGQASWYITEKDKGHPDDEVQGVQQQAFGLADLFGDGGEVGYISIAEILAAGGELDFYFTPKTIDDIRNPSGDAMGSETAVENHFTQPVSERESDDSAILPPQVPAWRKRTRQ